MLILIISVLLYQYIKVTIYEGISQSLAYEAKILSTSANLSKVEKPFEYFTLNDSPTRAKLVEGKTVSPYFVTERVGQKTHLTLFYPYMDDTSIALTKDTTHQSKLIDQILIDIIMVNATSILLIIFYVLFLSRMLLVPIKILSRKMTNLNERFLQTVSLDELPPEFKPLGKSLNRLIERIQTFVLYQKELFVGVAHELKTPLAVMKTKNEVTLIKPRESEKYIEALKNNNDSIDNMNKMISSILEIGRQEGAQFEAPEQTDIIAYLLELCVGFKILARTAGKDLTMDLKPEQLEISVQKSLFMHVIQNFIQNAIKFSPDGEKVLIESEISDGNFIVRVANKGEPLNEEIDYFAPFKRYGGKPGAGLGLFLAKNAAQAMGAQVDLKNDKGRSLIVAIFKLPLKNLRNSPKFRYFKTK